MGKQIFNIKGMMKDLDPAKSSNQYAYEIRNLRLTAQEDTTMLSLVSEKGNLQYSVEGDQIKGKIIGYCILNDYLVLFTYNRGSSEGHIVDDPPNEDLDRSDIDVDLSNYDRIYRLRMNNMTMVSKLLYEGDLGFTNNAILETLGIYENEQLQKVYWIDGVNQPRMINIVASDETLTAWHNMSICPFDFMLEMALSEQVTVNYEPNIFGMFPAGTIQYVLSYHNTNGQRTPAFYISTLYYTSINNRGGSPEETCNGAFRIQLLGSTVDRNFDYITIYSIIRTSLNGTPICKKVVDLKISDFGNNSIIYFIDNGLSSETVDYSEILYLGGSNIVPYTMEQKNNTLFFGNVSYKDFVIDKDSMNAVLNGSTVTFEKNNSSLVNISDSTSTLYPYKSQITYPASYITTYKAGESYYFGIIAQNKYGQWSNVIPLTTNRVTNNLFPFKVQSNGNDVPNQFQPVVAKVQFTNSVVQLLSSLGVKKVKLVRLNEIPQIACQGVLCPTVFNRDRVISNGSNYAQSSWFFRPIRYNTNDYDTPNKTQYYHNRNIYTKGPNYLNGEIQGSKDESVLYDSSNIKNYEENDFFVDWNILTMHSPEIEFGDQKALEGNTHLRIVGIVPIEYGVTSMFMNISSPISFDMDYTPIIKSNALYNSNDAPVCLSDWYYAGTHTSTGGTVQNFKLLIYPWNADVLTASGAGLVTNGNNSNTDSRDSQGTGSTVGTEEPGVTIGEESSEEEESEDTYSNDFKISSKCMATLRSSMRPLYIDTWNTGSTNYDVDITGFKSCSSVNPSIALDSDAHCNDSVRIYHGEVNALLHGEFLTYYQLGNTIIPSYQYQISFLDKLESEYIRMNYKSSPHGVFSIKYNSSNNKQRVLPHTIAGGAYPSGYPVESISSIVPPLDANHPIDYLYIADLVRNDRSNLQSFNGTNWIVSGKAFNLSSTIYGDEGDTYFQRYDCLKTYPFTSDAQNQIVDILSFMCETRINLEGRYDTLRGVTNNTMITDTIFNKMNMAYSQPDNFFTPQYYDSSVLNVRYFPNQIVWTKTKTYGSKIDEWTHVLPISSLDLDGSLGEIRSLNLWNDNLICFQDKGISKIMYNERTTISTEQGVPIEIANSGKVDGSQYLSNTIGCSNKQTIQMTQTGIYFADSNMREIYKLSNGINSLSKAKGFNSYFYDDDISFDSMKTFYDPKLKDVYFRINKPRSTECLVYSEQLDEFEAFYDYNMDFMFLYNDSLVSVTHNNTLWKQFAGDYLKYFGRTSPETYKIQLISAENPTKDKTFTNIEFRADVLDDSIIYSEVQHTNTNNYATDNTLPFQTIRVWNEYQDTLEEDFIKMLRAGTNMAQKFRIWRGLIGRDNKDKLHQFNRIRSPWARIELKGSQNGLKTVIHDIAVSYV